MHFKFLSSQNDLYFILTEVHDKDSSHRHAFVMYAKAGNNSIQFIHRPTKQNSSLAPRLLYLSNVKRNKSVCTVIRHLFKGWQRKCPFQKLGTNLRTVVTFSISSTAFNTLKRG